MPFWKKVDPLSEFSKPFADNYSELNADEQKCRAQNYLRASHPNLQLHGIIFTGTAPDVTGTALDLENKVHRFSVRMQKNGIVDITKSTFQ